MSPFLSTTSDDRALMPAIPNEPALFLVELKVADWSAAVRWYEETLGLELTLRDAEQGFALLQAGPARLGLKAALSDEPCGRRCRLIFQVDDLKAAEVRLRERGVEVSAPRDNAKEGYREIRLTDPEGTPITLFQWLRSPGGSECA